MSIIISVFATGYILGKAVVLYKLNKRMEEQLCQK